jgi:hypothetical protein
MTRITQKMTPPTIRRCRGNVFTELLPINDRGIHRQNHRLFFDKTRTAQEMKRQTIYLLLRLFVAAGARVPNRCLAMKGGIHIQTHRPMYTAKIGSGNKKLMGGGDSQIHRQHGDLINLVLFFQAKGNRLKRNE